MNTRVILLFFLLFPTLCFSQGEFHTWYFGAHAGVSFNSIPPIPLTNPSFYSQMNSTSISDSLGSLLYYSNGGTVFNRMFTVMPNGTGLAGSGGQGAQSIFSVQSLADDSLYYLFTIDYYQWPYILPHAGLRYSILNMRLNGGLGDIDINQKNISINSAFYANTALNACRHKNNKDVWIVVRLNDTSNRYASYKITQNGLDTIPVYSPSIVPHKTGANGQEINYIKISPDGHKLAALYSNKIEYCNFNDVTGVVQPLFTFTSNANAELQAGHEFSPDGKLFYVEYVHPLAGMSDIVQYDATKTDSSTFKSTEVILVSHPMGHCALQRAPDYKIYFSRQNSDSLGVINNPNVPGIGCNLLTGGFYLNGNMNTYGLPDFLERYYLYINHSKACLGDSIHFTSKIWTPADSVIWNFGDPASGVDNISYLPNPSHFYSTTGNYNVELYVRHIDNRTDTSWQTITIVTSPSVALGPDRSVCFGDSVTFDAGVCSGCTYLWKDLGSGLPVGTSQTFKTGQAGNYSVTVTNSNGCSGIDTVQLITTPIPVITNNQLTKSICSGESTSIPLTSNVAGTNFHWTATLTSGTVTGFTADSGLVINQILTNPISTPGVVTYHVTPKIGNCRGDTVDFQVTVNAGDSVKVSITASGNNVCAGTSVTYTAFPINPGLTPVYHWKVNGINSGTNSSTFSYTPVDTDVVTCELTSSLTVCISNNPATSNGITMTVNPNLAVSVTVTPTQNPVCAGTSVTFTAHPINEGTIPSYQWKVNGNPVGANLPTYTYIPLSSDGVTCTVNSNATCAVNNPAISPVVTMTVNPNLLVTVSIISSSNPFCAGSSVTFTATPNNGGTPPSYQWKVNGISVGANNQVYSYFPNNGDVVTCVLNSNIACPIGNPATSNSITMIVNANLPAGISITATPNPFCPGSSVTFNATPTNGGSTPSYQWKVNGTNVGTNSNTYSYNPANGDSVRCVMTSNLACVTSNPASSAKIIMSGTLAPIVTFTSCFDTITSVNAKPFKLKGGIPLGGTYSGPGVNSPTGVFTPSTAGTGTKIITYSYTNVSLCSASKSRNIIVQPAPVFVCGNNLTDIRDNKIYPSVQIGSQCWMAVNLNHGNIILSSQVQNDNCIAEKYCYNDLVTNCTNYGGLYQWDEMMKYDDTQAGQGFCPPGWHVPTENEWQTLFNYYNGNGFAGKPLQDSIISGFNALRSGVFYLNSSMSFNGFATLFWSSTSWGQFKALSHGMNTYNYSVSLYPSSRANAFPVRCLRD